MKNKLTCLLILWFPIMIIGQTNTFPASGNVGVGTTSPDGNLQVEGTFISDALWTLSSKTVRWGSYPNEYGGFTWDTGRAVVFSNPGNRLDLGSGSTTARLSIATNGNVGIGTTSPSSLLHTSNSVSSLTKVGVQMTSGVIGNLAGIGFATSGTLGKYKSAIGHITTKSSQGVGDLVFCVDGVVDVNAVSISDEKMRIKSDGNVGIGTTTPDSKLTVAGKIHAQEVKVTVTAGADFVFEDTYQRPTLKELESFIKSNKHLPEIASAKEMETEGLELGEMNIKLLQKIEELTLYTIEQEKKISEQKIKIVNLDDKLLKHETHYNESKEFLKEQFKILVVIQRELEKLKKE